MVTQSQDRAAEVLAAMSSLRELLDALPNSRAELERIVDEARRLAAEISSVLARAEEKLDARAQQRESAMSSMVDRWRDDISEMLKRAEKHLNELDLLSHRELGEMSRRVDAAVDAAETAAESAVDELTRLSQGWAERSTVEQMHAHMEQSHAAFDETLTTLRDELSVLREDLAAVKDDLGERLGGFRSSLSQIASRAGTPRTKVYRDGADVAERAGINFIPGANVTITAADNPTSQRTDVTIAASGGGGGSGHTIKEDGTPLTARAGLNFGAGLTASDDAGNDETDVVVAAGGVTNAMLAGSIALSKLATDPLARSNHTGSQASTTISDFAEAVQDVVGAMATDGTTVNFTYDDGAGTLTAEVQGLTSANLSDFAEAVRDRLGATLVQGTGITVTVDDPGDTVTIATTITQYTDEMAQDAIGTILADSATIDFTYTDGTPEITAIVKDGSITAAKVAADVATQAELDAVSGAIPSTEAIQDIVGGMVSGGTETGIAVTYDDTNARLDFVAEVTQAELDLKANDADVVHDTGDETIAGVKTFSSDPLIPDEAYDATAWNGVLEPPTKNAVRDKIEDILDGVTFTGDVVVPDEAYDATAWNGSLEVPTKNAVRDKIEALSVGGTVDVVSNVASDRVLGRDTAGSGDSEELTVGGGIEFTGSGGLQTSALTGDVTKTAGGTATTIANDAVTNAQLANMAQSTIKGRASGAGTGDPTDLSVAQVKTILGLDAITRHLPLPMETAITPDASGSGNNPATPEKIVSSGTQTTNSPKATYLQWLFDPTTDEHLLWAFTLPGDYSSGGTLRLTFSNKGTSTNGVTWKGAAAVTIPGTTDRDAVVFDTVVTANGTPSATTGIETQVTIALTMTNAAANRPIIVMVGRDPDNASDTNASDMALTALTFEYVASL